MFGRKKNRPPELHLVHVGQPDEEFAILAVGPPEIPRGEAPPLKWAGKKWGGYMKWERARRDAIGLAETLGVELKNTTGMI